jgi:hypothetical protein
VAPVTSEGWQPGQLPQPTPVMPREQGVILVPYKEMKQGHVYGVMPRMPEAGTGRILVYPCIPTPEEGVLEAHWEGEADGDQILTPIRFTTAKGYAPAVLMWAWWMPSATTVVCLTGDGVWLDLDEDRYSALMKDQ